MERTVEGMDDNNTFDWDKIHTAKRHLIQNIWEQPENDLWCLVELVNNLQEIAVKSGRWSFPKREPVFKKSKLSGPESPECGDLCWDYDRAVGMEWTGTRWKDIPYVEWVSRHIAED